MRRFRKGMVFTTDLDLAPDALAPVVEGSVRRGTSVTVAAAVSPRRSLVRRVISGLSETQLVDAVVSDTREKLERLAEPFRSAGLETSTEVLVGDPVVEVTRAVVSGGYDFVLKPVESGVPGESPSIGSMDFRLLRALPTPMWVFRPARSGQVRRILAAVEYDPTEPRHDELNRVVLETAASLAVFGADELHLIHAWRLWGEKMFRSGRARLPAEKVGEMVEKKRSTRAEWLEALAERVRASMSLELGKEVVVKTHLAEGSASPLILETAREIEARGVILGSLARAGLQGLLIGNTAEDVLRRIDISVIVVKLPTFVSPVLR